MNNINEAKLICSMYNSEKVSVKKAIEISGVQIYIKNKVLSESGGICLGMFGIHIKNRRIDATPFWRVYNKLKEKKLIDTK